MSSKREQMRDIFDRARRLPKPERAAFLDGLATVDGSMRAQIEDMLAALDEAGPFLSEPTQGHHDAQPTADFASAMTMAAPLREVPGTRIGQYRLLQLIGEGGFGSVFMAEQEKPVTRKVALKIIKLGMDTHQVVARFEQERQALAMMDHPNIARVFDAGATETGRPFFVMELVKGDPIVEYCDKNNLSIHDRLELFAQVCNAVQHAHTKGIIHRDIKPSNILVSTQDGRPHTKVIDFGIAKATASKLTEKTLFTEHKALIGTPEYMSPEQAEGSLDIDTRTDVYSLGVVLYELLTGTTPFSSQELRSAAYAEIQRIIRDVEPPKPSTRLSNNTDTIASVAAQRRIEPRKLGTLVRGELDWIVMRALEKDRQRRYETASGLGMDIQRYLSGEAVVAAPPSSAYRLKKFLRRNRVMVTAGSAVAFALLIGIVAFASQAKVASEQRDIAVLAQKAEVQQREATDVARAEAVAQKTEAEKQEAEARKQAAIAEAVAKFQTDMLAAVDPANLPKDPATGEPLKDKVTVLQTIEAAVKKLDEGRGKEGALKDQPLVEAGVRSTIGLTLVSLGRSQDAEPILRKALAIHRAALPEGHLTIAASMDNLAGVLHGGGTKDQAAEAESLYRQALAIRRAALPAEDPSISSSLNNLALHLEMQNKLTEAEPLFREAIAMGRAAPQADPPGFAATLDNLAKFLGDQNRHDEAEPLMREALEIRQRAFPAGHPQISKGQNNLAALYVKQQRDDKAEPLYREALATRRATLPAGHPDIANSLNNLATVLRRQERFAEAEPLHREALSIRRAALPAGHPDIAQSLNNLALLLKAQNKLAEAEPLYRESLEIRRKALPAGHPDIALALNNLALLLQNQGKLAEAEPLLRESLEIRRKALPAGHPLIAQGLNNLANVLREQKKLTEAEPLYRESLKIRRAALPAGSLDITASVNNLALILQSQKKFAEAEPLAREALELNRASLPVRNENIAAGLSSLASVQQGLGKTAEARTGWDEALAILRKGSPDGSALLATVLRASGTARLNNKDAAAALPELEEALAMAEKFLKSDDARLIEYRDIVTRCRASLLPESQR